MIIKTLLENTSASEALGSEHGLSLFVETKQHKLLFDTGASALFAENAIKMQVDLSKVDLAVISHGHYDHTWGLQPLVQEYIEASYEKRPWKKAKLITHPDSFLPKEAGGKNIGMILRNLMSMAAIQLTCNFALLQVLRLRIN